MKNFIDSEHPGMPKMKNIEDSEHLGTERYSTSLTFELFGIYKQTTF